tara:strand:+ start:2153 stop:2590 length:438 start_codon:yes stop_codon:yes gene_type:complete
MINTSNLNEARKQIQKLKKEKKPIIVQAQDDVFNRKILENKDIEIIIGLESHQRKDRLKQRDSGLNEIHCKLAKKNNIKIAIDIDNLKKQDKKNKAIILSRIIQNINLCKRTKTSIIFMPKQSKQDSLSFFTTFKGSTQQAKFAF